MIEHVLDLESLISDPTAVPETDLEQVKTVLGLLDEVDQYAADRSDGLEQNARGLTAALRAVLAPHWRNRRDGICAGCSFEVRPTWPCPAWRAAHRWLVELDPATGNRYEDEWFLMPEQT
jgi:hypothetical protein